MLAPRGFVDDVCGIGFVSVAVRGTYVPAVGFIVALLSRSPCLLSVVLAGTGPSPAGLREVASPDRRYLVVSAVGPTVGLFSDSSCARRFSSSSLSLSAFFFLSLSRRSLIISVGVRTPLLEC